MKNTHTTITKTGSLIALAVATVLSANIAQANTVIVNDSFADGGRNNGTDAADTNWWSTTTTGAIEISKGSLGLVSGGSGRGIRGTFAPQALANGQSIKATFTFTTPRTIGSNKESAFRIGLYNKAGRGGLEADLSASSKKPNTLYNGLPGYMIDFDVNPNEASKANINIRKHTNATHGRLLGTSKGYKSLGGGGTPYKFIPGMTYIGEIVVKRVGNGAEISGSLSQNNRSLRKTNTKVLSRFSVKDASSNVNNIGMLAFHVNSKTFGSSKQKNTPDNGLDFKNIKIEVIK